MPLLFWPLISGGAGLGLGFWAGDGFSSLLKILVMLAVAYLFYMWGLK